MKLANMKIHIAYVILIAVLALFTGNLWRAQQVQDCSEVIASFDRVEADVEMCKENEREVIKYINKHCREGE
jgi:hypothetical protein